MHGDDEQIFPHAAARALSAKLLKNGTLKTYKGFPHRMPTRVQVSASIFRVRAWNSNLGRAIIGADKKPGFF
jgi:hypothetical protein